MGEGLDRCPDQHPHDHLAGQVDQDDDLMTIQLARLTMMVPHLVALMLVASTEATSYKVVIGYSPQQLLTWITSTPEGFQVEETDVPGQTGQCQCRVPGQVSSSSSPSGPFTWPSCASSNSDVVWPTFESSTSLSPCSSSSLSSSSSPALETTTGTTTDTTTFPSSAPTTTTTTTTTPAVMIFTTEASSSADTTTTGTTATTATTGATSFTTGTTGTIGGSSAFQLTTTFEVNTIGSSFNANPFAATVEATTTTKATTTTTTTTTTTPTTTTTTTTTTEKTTTTEESFTTTLA